MAGSGEKEGQFFNGTPVYHTVVLESCDSLQVASASVYFIVLSNVPIREEQKSHLSLQVPPDPGAKGQLLHLAL